MSEETLHTSNQVELIRLCRKNDQKAFEQLYRLYNKVMYNVCVRMLNDTQDAEDALQESFISAFKNIEAYSKKSSFGSWLKRIVINKCIDVLRKKNNNLIALEDNFDLEEMDTESEVTYTIESIQSALKLLPDGYRLILTLFVFEDFTHQQIAHKLNISEGTSKSQYARGKQRLIQIIKSNTNNYER